VVLITSLVMLALVAWAVAPALFRTFTRPPGDGETLESYGFALEPCLVPRELIKPITLHRDMVPVMTAPASMPGADVAALNEQQRGKYLVSGDRVVGVVLNGEARAYPLTLLYVHEIIHDTLGGEPVAVTYCWPSDSPRIVRRMIDGAAVELAVSGLLYNSHALYYIRSEVDPASEAHVPESLWSQLEARAISGPAAAEGRVLATVPAQLTTWAHWLAAFPDTTVITEDPRFHKRYRQSEPKQYFIESDLIAPVAPLPAMSSVGLKDKVIAVRGGGVNRVYPISLIASKLDAGGTWIDRAGDVSIHFFLYDDASHSVMVTLDSIAPDGGAEVVHGLWFAIHAAFPDLPLAGDAAGPAVNEAGNPGPGD